MKSRGLSQQRARVTLSVVFQGRRVPLGQWSTADDAETSWDNQKDRPGALGRQQIIKALAEFGDRQFSRTINFEDVALYTQLRTSPVSLDLSASETFIAPDGREERVTSIGAMASISIGGSDYSSADVRSVSISMHVADVR